MVFSLLCCGYDEDQEDKEHNQQINNSNKNPRQRGGNTTRSTVQNSSKKDSYQINNFAVAQEGDDSKNAETPSEDDSKKLQKDKKELIEEENSINETETITNTNDDNATPPQGPEDPSSTQGIITQVSEDQPVIDPNEFLMEHDIDNINLTKIQEGQYCNPKSGFLLGPREPKYKNKKCLVLDLDETLVHSSFKYLRTADFVIPVEIDNQVHHVYVIKRPGVDEFLRRVGELFEVVVFTASVLKYGDPLLDKLDKNRAVNHRLFRDACYNYQGNFIKNLSQIGRPLNETIIIDNSPSSYIFHPQHAVPISSWFSDTHDNELLDMLPFLEDLSKSNVNDVGLVLDITI